MIARVAGLALLVPLASAFGSGAILFTLRVLLIARCITAVARLSSQLSALADVRELRTKS